MAENKMENEKETMAEQAKVNEKELKDNGAASDAEVQRKTQEDEASALELEKPLEETELDQIDKIKQERDEYKSALIQERADFENYKKRNAGISADYYNNGIVDTVLELLPVIDNFERALATECSDKAFAKGTEMIMKQLQDVIEKLGVEKIDTNGEFDPKIHDAVMQVEDEDFKANEVVETMQNGYKIDDKVLRYARVKVNK